MIFQHIHLFLAPLRRYESYNKRDVQLQEI